MNSEQQQNLHVKLLQTIPAPGYGFGSISFKSFEKRSNLAEEMIAKTHEVISSGECMVACDHDDDGCIDGRCVDTIAVPDGKGFSLKSVESNFGNERAKVAGGGLLTGLAMFKAIGEDLVSPDDDLAYLVKGFAQQGIYCGAHTGSHGSEVKQTTDCGANDKFGDILSTAIKNDEHIANVTKVLLSPIHGSYDSEVLQNDIRNWQHIVTETNNLSRSNGTSRLDVIRGGMLDVQNKAHNDERTSVIKNLGGDHNEIFVVVNYAKEKTFSQTKLREALHEEYPDVEMKALPQVFALDVWRVDQLAHAIACLPEKSSNRARTNDEKRNRYNSALYAGVAYQVATYTTLTDGTLPLFVVGFES